MIDGCLNKLVAAIEENAVIIAGVAIGIAALEVHLTFHVAYSRNLAVSRVFLDFINICLQATRAHY